MRVTVKTDASEREAEVITLDRARTPVGVYKYADGAYPECRLVITKGYGPSRACLYVDTDSYAFQAVESMFQTGSQIVRCDETVTVTFSNG